MSRNTWIKGRVVQVHPRKDVRTKIVQVNTAARVLMRPITKIIVFDTSDEGGEC